MSSRHFVLVVDFFNDKLKPRHIIVGIFEAKDTHRSTMAKQLDEMLTCFGLQRKRLYAL